MKKKTKKSGPHPHIRHIAVIGDGGWGTTLAIHLAEKGFDTRLWGNFPDYVEKVRQVRFNEKFLPGVPIPEQVILTSDLRAAMDGADLVVLAVPSQFLTGVLKRIPPLETKNKIFLSVIKGIDTVSLQRVSQIIRQQLGPVKLAVLSGPTIAGEVAKKIPTTAVIASPDLKIAQKLQNVFNASHFRIYTNTDVAGVEIGGSLKNIIAIACGVCDGLGFGTNAKAAILTRGLVEMARLGKALGAREETFAGLTGLGDLVTTCVSPQSRNRSVGEQLGKGRTIEEIKSSMEMVAEGVETVKAAYRLSRKHRIAMPITAEIYNILYKGKKPQAAVSALMSRKAKTE
ncbi:MAG: NAD(P)H-dependent glycerol-3-phosphate dehydrogenase [Candidatus Omnitrophota bacterium]|nr:NAD(P)H-dependent glycerol-3-phosphate dehydrogenase [Candidatus Omnitrophota bacterium]MDZ4241499.1 NAD(P)H-dependent glycerol-3-phosphate dehydrogenase [Candidatus Omnitrophota bacterium]